MGQGALPSRIGAYAIERLLARTDISEVYVARNSDGDVLCLKRLLPVHATPGSSVMLTFRREATLLADVSHPNVVRVLDVGEDEAGTPFLCLELIEGASLAEQVKEEGLPIRDAVDLLRQIALGLSRVHERGVVHADLKPANILLQRDVDATRVKIADFGLAADAATQTGNIAGTPHYMSPEQTRLVDWPIDFRSDLYSLGIMAFELVTGRLPFDADDPAALMKAQASKRPPRPSDFRPDIPPILERIILQLIAKNPAERYRTADSVAVDLERLHESLKAGDLNPEFPLDAAANLANEIRHVFVGRDQELGTLESAYAKAQIGRTEAIFVGGVAGVGKSVLLREFQNRSISSGARFATGKCYPFSRGLPYYVLAETLTDFHKRLGRAPAEERKATEDALRAAVGDLAGELIKVAPAYIDIFPDAESTSSLGDGRDRVRFLQLMVRVFEAIAPSSTPLVLIIDDLQWADIGTLQVIESIVDSLKECPLFILGTYRSEEIEPTHPFRALLDKAGTKYGLQRLDLEPFDAPKTALMIAEILRQPRSALPQELVDRIHDRTEGNPLFVSEVIKALLSSRAIEVDGPRLLVSEERFERTELPGSIVDFVLRRITTLATQTQELLGSAALVGKGFALDLLSHVANVTPEVCFSSIQEALAQNLLQPARNGVYRFHHDRVQEACSHILKDERREQTHLRIVDFLERNDAATRNDDDVFDLAEHASLGNDHARAWGYCREAGARAQGRYANDQALTFYRQALKHAEAAGNASKNDLREVRVKLAQVLELLGQYDQSITEYNHVLADPSLSVEEHADFLAKLATVYQKSGNLQEARTRFEHSLALLGVRIGHGRLGLLKARVRYVLQRARRGIFGPQKRTTRMQLIADILVRLWLVLVNSDAKRAPTVAYEMIASAVQLGESRELSIAHRTLLVTLMQLPRVPWDTAISHGRRAIEIAKALGLHLEAAVAAQHTANVSTVAVRYRDALSLMEWTREAFQSLGNMWELANAHIFSCLAYKATGRLDEAIVYANALIELGERINAQGTTSNGHQKLAELMFFRGETAKAESHMARSLSIAESKKLNLERFQAYKLLGATRVRQGKFSEARAHYSAAIRLMETPGVSFLPTYVWDTYFGYAETVLRDLDYFQASGGLEGDEGKKVAGYLKRGLKQERYLLGHLALGYRIQGHLRLRQKRVSASRRSFLTAMRILNEQDRPIDVAFTQLDAAGALKDAYPEECASWLRRARSTFEQQRMTPSIEQVDAELRALGQQVAPVQVESDGRETRALRELIDVSQMLMQSRDPDLLLERIVDASMSLLGAERGFIFLREREDEPLALRVGKTADGQYVTDADARISRGVVERVDQSGQGLAVSDTHQDASLRERRSITVFQLRSILCAPLVHSGHRIGVLYVDSQMTNAIFEATDLEVIQSLAAQAATALSNAMQFRTIELMNRELDERVLDRTRQLESANLKLKDSLDELRNTTLRLAEAKREALEKELEVARSIQIAMVPERRIFETTNGDVIGMLEPASMCGGDFWTFSAANEKLLLFIGDVTGHGVGSAMVTTVAKSCLETMWLNQESPPRLDNLMAILSDVVQRSTGGQLMMTAFAVEVDPRARELCYCVAGHYPQALVTHLQGQRKVSWLRATSMRLGDGLGNTFPLQRVPYGPGDFLVLFTDGLVEGESPEGSPYGSRRLQRLMQNSTAKTCEGLLSEIESDARAFFGAAPQEDDIAVVIAELKPTG